MKCNKCKKINLVIVVLISNMIISVRNLTNHLSNNLSLHQKSRIQSSARILIQNILTYRTLSKLTNSFDIPRTATATNKGYLIDSESIQQYLKKQLVVAKLFLLNYSKTFLLTNLATCTLRDFYTSRFLGSRAELQL